MTVKTEFLRRITASSVAKRGPERRNDCKNGVSEENYSSSGGLNYLLIAAEGIGTFRRKKAALQAYVTPHFPCVFLG